MDRAQELLQALPLGAMALAGAALAALAALLYVLVDAVRYSRIPTLDVPLTEGMSVGARAAVEREQGAGVCFCRHRQQPRCVCALTPTPTPKKTKPPPKDEAAEELSAEKYKPSGKAPPKGKIACYDPSTMQLLGYAKAMTPAEVGFRCGLCVGRVCVLDVAGHACTHRRGADHHPTPYKKTPNKVRAAVADARAASVEWRRSTFAQRRRLMRVLLKFIIAHQRDICRVSARDSGKTQLEAALGEIIVTAEKLRWLAGEGEAALRPERRSAGVMVREVV